MRTDGDFRKGEPPRVPEGSRGALESEPVCEAVTGVGARGEDTSAHESLQAYSFDDLLAELSEERMAPYLRAAGFDRDRALALYLWNVEVGAGFHLPVQAVEVGLRNRVAAAFAATYGASWWSDPEFRKVVGREGLQSLEQVERRLANRQQRLSSDRVVGGLSFGFWIELLQPRHNPAVWSRHFRAAFSTLPADVTRDDVRRRAGAAVGLRNRIDHHEPIFGLDLSKQHSDLLTLLEWICPHKRAWIEPRCLVPAILRRKP